MHASQVDLSQDEPPSHGLGVQAHPVAVPGAPGGGYLWIYDRFYSLANILRRLPRNRKQWLPFLLFIFGYRKFGKWTSVFGRLTSMAAMGRLGRRLAYGLE